MTKQPTQWVKSFPKDGSFFIIIYCNLDSAGLIFLFQAFFSTSFVFWIETHSCLFGNHWLTWISVHGRVFRLSTISCQSVPLDKLYFLRYAHLFALELLGSFLVAIFSVHCMVFFCRVNVNVYHPMSLVEDVWKSVMFPAGVDNQFS